MYKSYVFLNIIQINAYPSGQRRKMKNFSGYQRKAVVIVSSEEEYKSRGIKQKPIDGKEVTDSMLLEIKGFYYSFYFIGTY